MSTAIVMTTYNTPRAWLVEAYKSTGKTVPSVIVDDGSTHEETLSALAWLGVVAKVIYAEHTGIGGASNIGIAATTAKLIGRLDSDDHMMPGNVELLSRYLETHPDVDVVSGGMRYIAPDGAFLGTVMAPVMEASPTHNGTITHSGCMFRRSLWERVGGYPADRAADYHFWIACEKAGARFTVLDTIVIERRIHPDSFSFKHSKHLQSWWRKVKQ